MQQPRSEQLRATERPHPLIPVYRPELGGNERRYVLECLDTGWISSLGAFVERFEQAVCAATGERHAIGLCNGTVALHLALHCLGIGRGDEVIVPSFTYIASVNTIVQTGAVPVFADCRPDDWLIDPADVEARITPRTKAILPVHLYGAACNMEALCTLARERGLGIVEDCAEAFGTTIDERHVGTFGDVGTFSFFGNKTITTGEGGMVITHDDRLAARMRLVRGQGQSPTRRYWHEELGFNYRMTNIVAAIGLAQTERLDAILSRKREIAAHYRELLSGLPIVFQRPGPGVSSSQWLVTVLLPKGADRERLMADMSARAVDTRPTFYCAHQMPMYDSGEHLSVSEDVSARGISLPSYPSLTGHDIQRVAEALSHALKAQGFA